MDSGIFGGYREIYKKHIGKPPKICILYGFVLHPKGRPMEKMDCGLTVYNYEESFNKYFQN